MEEMDDLNLCTIIDKTIVKENETKKKFIFANDITFEVSHTDLLHTSSYVVCN